MAALSVVIPTYNRGPRLKETLSRVLASRIDEVGDVEVIVVDDGSSPPAQSHLEGGAAIPKGFTLRVVRQENAGPARARNTGFRASTGEVVLFVDDDILVPPDLLAAHVAAHAARPNVVICGRCPWLPPAKPDAVFRLLSQLGYDRNAESADEFVPMSVVASGQISVERHLFSSSDPVYHDDLETPAAEEYELSRRLQKRRIEAFLARRIVAEHDSSVSIEGVCRQQYKHGLGCAEAAQRCPETLDLRDLEAIVARARTPAKGVQGSLEGSFRALLTSPGIRGPVLLIAKVLERVAPQADAFMPIYRLALSLHFLAGVRDGLRHYSEAARC